MTYMCAARAKKRWKEMPPKKMANIGIHLKFSIKAEIKLFSPRRYLNTARQKFPRPENTTRRATKIFQESM